MTSQIQDLMPPIKTHSTRRFFSVVWGAILVLLFAMTTFATGYWFRDYEARDEKLIMRKEHLAEIDRLTRAYGRDIASVSVETKQAAEALTTTAEEVSKAAEQSKRAANQASKAATAVSKIDKVPEPTRQQINRRVEEINKRVQK